MELKEEIIDQLTWRGMVAYIAIARSGRGTWTTANLASLVGIKTEIMFAGLEELSILHPEIAYRDDKRKWCTQLGEEHPGVRILDHDSRRRAFIDDLKKIWDWANPPLNTFRMGAADGNAINQFLRLHKDWDQQTWRIALRHRFTSEAVNKGSAPYTWLAKLGEYLECPLDRYRKPMQLGGEKLGKSLETENGNHIAREAAITAHGTRP